MGWLNWLTGADTVEPVHLETAADFEQQVLNSELPVILDIWGPNCPPCRRLAPVMSQVATRHQGKVRVAELSTSHAPSVLSRLGVMATPTIVMFDQGQEVGRVTGFRPPGWFDEMIAAEFS